MHWRQQKEPSRAALLPHACLQKHSPAAAFPSITGGIAIKTSLHAGRRRDTGGGHPLAPVRCPVRGCRAPLRPCSSTHLSGPGARPELPAPISRGRRGAAASCRAGRGARSGPPSPAFLHRRRCRRQWCRRRPGTARSRRGSAVPQAPVARAGRQALWPDRERSLAAPSRPRNPPGCGCHPPRGTVPARSGTSHHPPPLSAQIECFPLLPFSASLAPLHP